MDAIEQLDTKLFRFRVVMPSGKTPELTDNQVEALISADFIERFDVNDSQSDDDVGISGYAHYRFISVEAFLALLFWTYFYMIDSHREFNGMNISTIYIRHNALELMLKDILFDYEEEETDES